MPDGKLETAHVRHSSPRKAVHKLEQLYAQTAGETIVIALFEGTARNLIEIDT